MKRAQFTDRKFPLINNVSIVRTWSTNCSPIVGILRHYLSNQQSLLRTVYAMDTEIQRKTEARSSFIQRGAVPFLAAPKTALGFALSELKTDYLPLDSVCRVLSKRMKANMSLS
jgi:hypothetical protein